MGHLGEISDDGMAVDVLAESDRDAGLGLGPFLGLEQVTHDDLGLDEIGHFDPDGAFAGDWGEDVNAFGLEGGPICC